ncbi:MAG: hypothetical protein IJW23_06030 [Lentisphaeria bacterium]|nr:hypothetical protein [Lentisphaeria bacterium]
MKKKSVILFLSALILSVQANMREVSFYCATPAKSIPVIDGKLDDPCWNVPEYTASYEYFKPNPGPGQLKNSIRMIYNERGLYIGIIHYDNNPKTARATITDRDNPNLWMDDCTEFYIDPDAAAIGWRKFVINILGSVTDVWRIDSSVYREDWTADGWEMKIHITENSWQIENFMPWSVFNKKASAGDIWTFCHVRYSWGTGKFIGTTSCPGANNNATHNFGYLCFVSEKQTVNLNEIAKTLSSRIAPPWCIGMNNEVIFDEGDGMKKASLDLLIGKEKQRIEKVLRIKNIPPKFAGQKAKLQKEYEDALKNIPKSIQLMRTLSGLAGKLEKFQWAMALDRDFN